MLGIGSGCCSSSSPTILSLTVSATSLTLSTKELNNPLSSFTSSTFSSRGFSSRGFSSTDTSFSSCNSSKVSLTLLINLIRIIIKTAIIIP